MYNQSLNRNLNFDGKKLKAAVVYRNEEICRNMGREDKIVELAQKMRQIFVVSGIKSIIDEFA